MKHTIQFVRANRGFRQFFFAVNVSSIGDGMQFVGIAWLLTRLTGETSSMGWLLAMQSIPAILFSPWIGVMVDRWDRRYTCMAADLLRGVIILLVPLLFYLHDLQVWMIYLVVFFVSIGDRFYFPASAGLVREIVPVDDLLTANSLSNMCMQLGYLFGTGIGGVIIAGIDPVIVMIVNSASFFLSASFTFFVRRGKQVVRRSDRKATTVYHDFVEGVQYLGRNPYLIGLGVLQLFLFLSLYTGNVLLPAFSMNVLQVGSRGFGFIDGSWAVGAILGSIMLLSLIKKMGSHRFVTPGMFLLGAAILFFGESHGLLQAICGYLLMGVFFVSSRINTDTMLQTLVPTDFQGRVRSTISMAVAYISFGVYVGVGYLGDAISLRLIYLVLAFLIVVGAVLSIPFSRIRQVPNDSVAQ